MKARLNKRTIDEAEYQGPGGCYLWDTEMTGFGIRIYPTGRKSFVVNYWSRGRRRFYTLGTFGKLTLQQARTEALEVFLRVRQGEDPSAQRLTDRRLPTVTDLADRHIKDHAAINNKPRSVERARRLWDRCVLPKLGKRRVADIHRKDIAKLMTEMASTPSMANKMLTQLSKAFNLAEIWEWRPEGTNPCRHVSRYREEARERYLSPTELARLGEVLATMETERTASTYAVAAIRLLLLTGCRSKEILHLRWADIDFEQRRFHLADSKTGKRTVVLNAGALAILDGLQRVDGNPYVLPGHKEGRPISSLQKLWNRCRVDANIQDVRVHDIRHTHASVGINNGLNLSVIGRLLGHSKILTTQRYAHLADDPIRQASEQIGATLTATLSGQTPASDHANDGSNSP